VIKSARDKEPAQLKVHVINSARDKERPEERAPAIKRTIIMYGEFNIDRAEKSARS
jgi:hypothetical protein